MKKKYQAAGLQVIGIHTPEFDFEKSRAQVLKVARKYGDDWPIMMDNDYAFWNALGNRYWPSFYLVDQQGNIVDRAIGEMHEGEYNAQGFEKMIVNLLTSGKVANYR